MRVGIVTPRYPPNVAGGGEISVKLLADQLYSASEIDDVQVFSFDGRGNEPVDSVPVRRLGSVSTRLKESGNLRVLRRLRGRLDAFDVVHAYNMAFDPAIGVLSSLEGWASVATLNSYEFFPKSAIGLTSQGLERVYELMGYPTTGQLLLRAFRRIDAFIALSRTVERIYRSNGWQGERIEVIPNMIDPSFEVPTSDEKSVRSGYTLLYVGALKPIKGVDVLVRSMSQLPDDVTLRVAGDGPAAPRLRSLADEIGVRDRVEFLGHVPYDQLLDLYGSADLFVHPGIWPEPFGRTILESMQAGLPVVATDIGGPSEIIPDEELLCEPNDPTALARTIDHARETLSDRGPIFREYVAANYSPSEVLPGILERYREVS